MARGLGVGDYDFASCSTCWPRSPASAPARSRLIEWMDPAPDRRGAVHLHRPPGAPDGARHLRGVPQLLPFRQKPSTRGGAARRLDSRWAGSTSTSATRTPPATPWRATSCFHPGGISETEILLPYGGTRFATKVGPLAGNHFLTMVEGREELPALGRLVLWEGAQDIVFEAG